MIEDPNRYQNWYHGLTKVSYPKNEYKGFVYSVETSATSGNFSTQYFGSKSHMNKIEGNINFEVKIIKSDKNSTFALNVDKITLEEDKVELCFCDTCDMCSSKKKDIRTDTFSYNAKFKDQVKRH